MLHGGVCVFVCSVYVHASIYYFFMCICMCECECLFVRWFRACSTILKQLSSCFCLMVDCWDWQETWEKTEGDDIGLKLVECLSVLAEYCFGEVGLKFPWSGFHRTHWALVILFTGRLMWCCCPWYVSLQILGYNRGNCANSLHWAYRNTQAWVVKRQLKCHGAA